MMKLKTIKEKQGDKHYTKYVFREMDLIKENISIDRSAVMFFIGYFYFGQIFFSNGKIYIANVQMDFDEYREPVVETMYLTELHGIRLLKDYPKVASDVDIKTIIKSKNFNQIEFIQNIFIPWIDEPCDWNYQIDNPYYEIIKFLNDYNTETFRKNRFLFYSKRDDDYNFINNIYAYDLKYKTEIKLYIPNKSEKIKDKWIDIPPQKLTDITVDDLGQNISNYKKRQCKKAFLKLANEENKFFKVENYWVMELIKLVVQPVLILHEWSCHRCFCKPKLFCSIWVYDFPTTKEEPSFFIADEHFTKVAVLKFKKPEYLVKGIYKRGLAKAKGWELSEQEKKELTEFFNKPSEKVGNLGSGTIYNAYEKYVKTNWQQLIFEYNHNTAYWDIDEPISNKVEGEIEQLPFDLPLSDYRKLR